MNTINTEIDAEADGEIEGLLATVTKMTAEWERARKVMGGTATEIATGWLTPRYLVALRGRLASGPDEAERFKLLRLAAGDVTLLQRGGVWVGRLHLEREKFKFQKKRRQDLMGKLSGANGKRRDLNEPMTEGELKAFVDKVDEIMGLK
ncbi:MAG TPA: hypothetical protein VG347_16240 [Verrucomicrobiae bacterium]|nr:hypothetical protein [Verrucomicrobiae bacterium]